jgi:DNA repair protein RecO (recombination protein O)
MPRPERSARTDAIVLRHQEYAEADRLLTVFTPEHGKLRLIAKSVVKPGGRKTGHVELFTRSAMLITWGREIHIVSQVEMQEPYLPLREDIARAAYSNYLVELLDQFIDFEEANRAAYHLLNAALGWLCEAEADLPLVARFFELKLLSSVGFEPSLFRCAVGQEEIKPQNQYFSVVDGGLVCPDHVRHSTALIPVNLDVIKLLRYIQSRDYATIKKLRISAPVQSELESLLQSYILHTLERRLKSVEFIRRLRVMDS